METIVNCDSVVFKLNDLRILIGEIICNEISLEDLYRILVRAELSFYSDFHKYKDENDKRLAEIAFQLRDKILDNLTF